MTPILQVYGEYRSEVEPDIFPLRQPSFATDCSPAASMTGRQEAGQDRPLDHRLQHHLVHRAQLWLLGFRQDQRAAALSPSIYWSIRSLCYFYAASIQQAEQEGAPRHGRVDDDEWPEPPSGEDTYDWSLVPNWLYDLINMENLHEWGLRDIRMQRGCFLGGNAQRVHAMMDLYIREIPTRELDDPPDGSDGAGSENGELIEELSAVQIEDNCRV